jgi:hypothetical protein
VINGDPATVHEISKNSVGCWSENLSARAWLVLILVATGVTAHAAEWQDKPSQQIGELTVAVSEPVLVARRSGYLWFPTLVRLADGKLLAVMSNYLDDHVQKSTAQLCWSGDGGLTWSKPQDGLYSDAAVRTDEGDLLLPYYLRPRDGGEMGDACQLVPKGGQEAKTLDDGVRIGNWPRPDRMFAPNLGLSGFVFNGSTVPIKGGHLAMLYGFFKDTKRYSLVAAESADGRSWKVCSVVADENCELPGAEGPCEQATCRLKDGRLMCVFRLASNVLYGQTFSDDDGQTWSKPVSIKGPSSVQPALAVLNSGPIVLTGGRPGLRAWFNAKGDGVEWSKLDLLAHHNACRPDDPIANAATGTSAYTEVVPLDDTSVLCIYDRLARGWNAIPAGSKETNSVWVVRMIVKGKQK